MNDTIFITGGAKRIGKAIVAHFHKIGWNVIFQYRTSSESAKLISEELNGIRNNSCFAYQADLDSLKDINRLCNDIQKNHNNLKAIINNASTFYPKPITEVDEEDWESLISSNLKAPIFISKNLAEDIKNNKGAIVNMVDIYAEQGLANYTIYSAAKAGLYNLTKSLAKELAPNVTVNSVSPGIILWDETNPPDEEKQNKMLSEVPLRRMGNEKDIVSTVDFLVTKNKYMTGRNINVDGGKSLG